MFTTRITNEKIKVDDNAVFLDGVKICSFKDDGHFFTAAHAFIDRGWQINSFGRGLLELYSIEERTTIVLECFSDEIEVSIYGDC